MNKTIAKNPSYDYLPELLKHSKSQDEPDYEVLLNQYSHKVYRLAMSLVENSEEAEDVTLEVFTTVKTRLADLNESEALPGWIYRITIDAALMKTSVKNRLEITSFEENLPKIDHNGRHDEPVTDWSVRIEEKASIKEIMNFVKKNLKCLPDTEKVVLLLSDVEGLSEKAVADILDTSLTAVRCKLNRARFLMRERLSRYYKGMINA
jgi:RNA polymerase sigma-70 factor (ECF subfamily)